MLAVERRHRVAATVAALERDLAVDPGLAAVERGEETGRHDRLAGAGGVVEAVVVVVRAGNEVIRIVRVHGDRDLVIRREVLAKVIDVATDVDCCARVAGTLAAEPFDLLLAELAVRAGHAWLYVGVQLERRGQELEGEQAFSGIEAALEAADRGRRPGRDAEQGENQTEGDEQPSR